MTTTWQVLQRMLLYRVTILECTDNFRVLGEGFDTFLLMREDGSRVVHFVRCLSYVLHCQVSRPTNFSFRMKMLSPTYINSFLLFYFQALVFESSAYASVVLKG